MAIRQAGGKVFFEEAGRLVDNLQSEHADQRVSLCPSGLLRINGADFQEAVLEGSEISFHLLERSVPLIYRLGIHHLCRYLGFHHITAVQKRGLAFALYHAPVAREHDIRNAETLLQRLNPG